MKPFILLILLTISLNALSQTPKRFIKSFDPSGKLYNKHTGEKISDAAFNEYIKDNPRVTFDYEIDKFGEVSKYLLDTTSRTAARINSENKVAVGNKFPEFVFRSIDEKLIASAALKGQWVILKFELFLQMADTQSYEEFNQKLTDLGDQHEIVTIICLMESESQVREAVSTDLSNIHLIPDASNFHIRYGISSTPSLILINPEGKVVDYYRKWSEIDLKNLTN
jgi:peroxiredoxin